MSNLNLHARRPAGCAQRAALFAPEPESELLRRLPEALGEIHRPRLGLSDVGPENFFDFESGLRAVISRVRAPNGVLFTQVTIGFVSVETRLRFGENEPVEHQCRRIVAEWFPGHCVVSDKPSGKSRLLLLMPKRPERKHTPGVINVEFESELTGQPSVFGDRLPIFRN